MIPVILIHSGYQDYLNYSILQSAKKNKLYLIGDTNPNIDHENFNFANINNFTARCQDFSKNYVHLSTNEYNYELFCYHRWFILKNFMEANNIDVVFYIDSDVLFFENAEEEWQKFNQYDLTLLHRSAGTSSFVTHRGVSNFCDMLIDIYSKKDEYHFSKIASHFEVRRTFGLNGGVCDMTLLEYFHYHAEFGGGPGRVGEMMAIIDDTTYDHNINSADQDFEYENGKKKLKIIDKEVFAFNQKMRKDIKFNSVHLQGEAKYIMKEIYERCLEE
jgi:hypothetical protein